MKLQCGSTGGIRKLSTLRDPELNSPVACSRSLPVEVPFALPCLFHVLCCVHWFVCVMEGLFFLLQWLTFCIGGPSRLPAGLELKALWWEGQGLGGASSGRKATVQSTKLSGQCRDQLGTVEPDLVGERCWTQCHCAIPLLLLVHVCSDSPRGLTC